MDWKNIYTKELLRKKADALFALERQKNRLDGWFYVKEIEMKYSKKYENKSPEIKSAYLLSHIIEELPISIEKQSVFAGTQRDAFARSYALINPAFTVESFKGYCDPLEVFNYIKPNKKINSKRIAKVKQYLQETNYIKELSKVYDNYSTDMEEVAYFVEQVTGHIVADFRTILENGISKVIKKINKFLRETLNTEKKTFYYSLKIVLNATLILAKRYSKIACNIASESNGHLKKEFELIAKTLDRVPRYGARNLFEAIQSFIILWQIMCLEQTPNPFAFSAGNVDRIFEPYRLIDGASIELTSALFSHFLTFFNIGDRSWAISQNFIISGKSNHGEDLTSDMTYAILDAFYECNYPQPILSIKLHKKTPSKLYEMLGKFFFTPGKLTPSFFNDDEVFNILKSRGIQERDLEDYAIAGCQEPLIMGKENGNTTNSWLNLAKILELTVSGGISTLSKKKIGLSYQELFLDEKNPFAIFKDLKPAFYRHLDYFLTKMCNAANACSIALSSLRVPFLSSLMGSIESGIDMRDDSKQGTLYNGSGCLIHGLSVVSDSFLAIEDFLKLRPQDAKRLLQALLNNFEGAEDIRQFLATAPKYGNGILLADNEAEELANIVADKISALKNYLGNPFRPDFSTPTTHLLYGYFVGATPDGRHARDMLNYGIDPLYGEATSGLNFRILSTKRMPFLKMIGGYASHFGIDPRSFTQINNEDKGKAFRDRVIYPLFFNRNEINKPFYLYVNVTTPETLREVLKNPKKYAPSGIYIMRIHGTFVNFLDLSPAIQEDIIKRLDPESTKF